MYSYLSNVRLLFSGQIKVSARFSSKNIAAFIKEQLKEKDQSPKDEQLKEKDQAPKDEL